MKRKLISALVLLSTIGLSSCGNIPTTSEPTTDESTTNPTTSVQPIVNHKVTFETNGGTDMSSVTIYDGDTLAKPNDPTKEDHMFDGWFLDEGLTLKAEFPLSIIEDVTLYASFIDYKTYYLRARDLTVKDQSLGFKYNSNLDVTVGYGTYLAPTLSVKGTYDGVSTYSKNDELSYLQIIEYKDPLFPDQITNEFIQNTKDTHITLNKHDFVTDVKTEELEEGKKYSYSSYAKSLFEYEDSDIKEVKKDDVGDRYLIESKQGFTSIAESVLNNLNHPIVEIIIGNLPETNSTYKNYVTFSPDGTLKSYTYSFIIEVSKVFINFSYTIDFVEANKAQEITLPTYEGLSLNYEEKANSIATVSEKTNAYLDKDLTSYDYEIKSGVKFEGANEINTTIKGGTKRKIDGYDLFFNNKVEIDSDLKNADLYKEEGIVDYNSYIANLQNNDTYFVEDPTVGFNKYTEICEGKRFCYLYFLGTPHALETTYVQKLEKDTETKYSFGSKSNNYIANILNEISDTTFLKKTNETKARVFGTFEETSLVDEKTNIIYVFDNNELKSIEFKSEGTFKTMFEDSRDFATLKDAKYSISYKLDVKDITSYKVPTTQEEIEKNY